MADCYWQIAKLESWGVAIYNQIVTWTAFAILAMFLIYLRKAFRTGDICGWCPKSSVFVQPPFNSYCLELFLSGWLFQRKSIWKRSFPMLLARDLYFPPSLKRLCETRLLNSAKLIFGHPVYLWRQRSKYIGMGCDDRPVPNLDLPWRSSSQKIMGMEGKGQATKSEKFQTAFDPPPPHFRKIILHFFYVRYGCVYLHVCCCFLSVSNNNNNIYNTLNEKYWYHEEELPATESWVKTDYCAKCIMHNSKILIISSQEILVSSFPQILQS